MRPRNPFQIPRCFEYPPHASRRCSGRRPQPRRCFDVPCTIARLAYIATNWYPGIHPPAHIETGCGISAILQDSAQKDAASKKADRQNPTHWPPGGPFDRHEKPWAQSDPGKDGPSGIAPGPKTYSSHPKTARAIPVLAHPSRLCPAA
ncbi:hypothetical protein SDC9_164138 [bioreactor metagenome]|uniref:Uncharacterized protein n=1 Tax=bioreactor metagenome TaxID=1076179 RepID=A0A645FQV2_9ZZZZ